MFVCVAIGRARARGHPKQCQTGSALATDPERGEASTGNTKLSDSFHTIANEEVLDTYGSKRIRWKIDRSHTDLWQEAAHFAMTKFNPSSRNVPYILAFPLVNMSVVR